MSLNFFIYLNTLQATKLDAFSLPKIILIVFKVKRDNVCHHAMETRETAGRVSIAHRIISSNSRYFELWRLQRFSAEQYTHSRVNVLRHLLHK